MPDVTLKDAFDVYQKQTDSLHKAWGYFQTVSLAVLGYTIGSDKSQWSVNTYLLIGFSYAFFAAANLYVIVQSQKELVKFGEAVDAAAKLSGPIGAKLVVRATEPWKIGAFHSASALIVVAALFAVWVDKCQGENKVCPAAAQGVTGVSKK